MLFTGSLRKYACALAALLFTGSASAGWFSAQIDRMQISPAGTLSVYFHSGVTHECGSNRVDFVNPDAPGFKYIFAALLTYETVKDPVQFLIASCSGTTGIFTNIEGAPG